VQGLVGVSVVLIDLAAVAAGKFGFPAHRANIPIDVLREHHFSVAKALGSSIHVNHNNVSFFKLLQKMVKSV
jgi:hypothetical protein